MLQNLVVLLIFKQTTLAHTNQYKTWPFAVVSSLTNNLYNVHCIVDKGKGGVKCESVAHQISTYLLIIRSSFRRTDYAVDPIENRLVYFSSLVCLSIQPCQTGVVQQQQYMAEYVAIAFVFIACLAGPCRRRCSLPLQ